MTAFSPLVFPSFFLGKSGKAIKQVGQEEDFLVSFGLLRRLAVPVVRLRTLTTLCSMNGSFAQDVPVYRNGRTVERKGCPSQSAGSSEAGLYHLLC